jgi:serine/threonine-protein kinase
VTDEELHDEEPMRESIEARSWADLLEGALHPGDVLAGKYRVDELLGWGAMGFVLRAWHTELDEPVAVKLLLPELAQNDEALVRFEREARVAFKIKSEHVTRVLDVGRLESGQPYMVMEFLDGVELGELVYGSRGVEPKALPIHDVIDYVLQACDALLEAHGLGIVHRDLKPDNLFLARRNDGTHCVKLLDFGLSKLVSRASRAPRERAITGEAQAMGTAHYMSPEQWVAAKTVGPAADIWALGVILYEAVSGSSPFQRNNYAAMCNAVLHEEPPPLAELRPDVPPGLDEAIRGCLKKAPEERYASVADLAAALLPFAAPGTRPPPGLERGIAEESRRPDTLPPPPPGSIPDMRPAGAPPLGLLGPHGVETWRDLQHEAVPKQRSYAPILFVLVLVALVVAAAAVVL